MQKWIKITAITAVFVMVVVALYDMMERKNELEVLTQECQEQNATACNQLGHAYTGRRNSFRLSHDTNRGLKFFKQACELGLWYSCDSASKIYRYGYGRKGNKDYLEANNTKAQMYKEKSCDKGNGYACKKLAIKYALGLDVPKDRVKADNYYEKACTSTLSSGCTHMAYKYLNGNGVKINLTKAYEMFEKEIKSKAYERKTQGYYGLGQVAQKREQYLEAFDYYSKACEKINDACCRMVEISKYTQLSEASELLKNMPIYQKRCEGSARWAK